MKDALIAKWIDDHGITCDCCQHVMIDVTAVKTGVRQHCTVGDPEGDGVACASGLGHDAQLHHKETEGLSKDLRSSREEVAGLLTMMVREKEATADWVRALDHTAANLSAEIARLTTDREELLAVIRARNSRMHELANEVEKVKALAERRGERTRRMEAALGRLLKAVAMDDTAGYIGDADGLECQACDGKGKEIADIQHEEDCFQNDLEIARTELRLVEGVEI